MKKANRGVLSRVFGGRARLLYRMARALKTYGMLLRDWWQGRYRPLPKRATALMAITVLYIVSPLDLIPDVILGWGFLDDLVIGGWLLTKLDDSLVEYRRWQERQGKR